MKHKWWHFMFEHSVGFQYRFLKRWYGTQVQYRDVGCSICKKLVRQRYEKGAADE